MELRRTAAHLASGPGEFSGREDLLDKFNLLRLEQAITEALHLDYSNPTSSKKFDAIAKLPGPAAMKQFYRGPLPDPVTGLAPPARWSLLQVANWPPHSYPWPAYSVEDIRAAANLQPGTSVQLSPEARGIPTPPIRTDPAPEIPLQQQSQGAPTLPHEGLATASTSAIEAAAAAAAAGGADEGGGPRTRRKASRAASAAIAAAAVGDEGPEESEGGRGGAGRKRGRR